MFYTKEIEVWRESAEVDLGGGLVVSGEPSLLGVAKVDVQPYSRELSIMEYGLDLDVTNVIFAPVMEVIPGRDYIRYRGEEYRVLHIIEWDEYVEIFISRRR